VEAESVYFDSESSNKKYQTVVEVIKSLWTKEPTPKNNKKNKQK